MATRSKACVCGRSLAGITGSNPPGGMDVRLLWLWCVCVIPKRLGWWKSRNKISGRRFLKPQQSHTPPTATNHTAARTEERCVLFPWSNTKRYMSVATCCSNCNTQHWVATHSGHWSVGHIIHKHRTRVCMSDVPSDSGSTSYCSHPATLLTG